MTDRAGREEQIAQIRGALNAAYGELWQTYGDTPRVAPLFDRITSAREALSRLSPPLQEGAPKTCATCRFSALVDACCATDADGDPDVSVECSNENTPVGYTGTEMPMSLAVTWGCSLHEAQTEEK